MRQSEEDREHLRAHPPGESYLRDGTTVMSWLNTRDHKRIGVMFLVAVIFFLFIGGVFALALWAMIHGGADTGWTFYVPYSATTPTDVLPLLIGVFVIGFSSIETGINFIVTVHTLRAPGITWMR